MDDFNELFGGEGDVLKHHAKVTSYIFHTGLLI